MSGIPNLEGVAPYCPPGRPVVVLAGWRAAAPADAALLVATAIDDPVEVSGASRAVSKSTTALT
jgi:hypothetical protein